MTQAIAFVLRPVECGQKPAEHLRNDVFATVKECRQDLFCRARIGKRHCMRDKGLHMGRCTDPLQGYFDRYAIQHKRTELLELMRAGANVAHGAKVES